VVSEPATYQFLSPEWVAAAHEIRAELGDPADVLVAVTMNLTVTDAPFAADPIEAHLDTREGAIALEFGHRTAADMLITVDWSTAKSMLVDGDTSAAMSAFMNGRIRVEGDMSKLIALQGARIDGRSERVVARLRAITA
jgi:putative sterol carrier protein